MFLLVIWLSWGRLRIWPQFVIQPIKWHDKNVTLSVYPHLLFNHVIKWAKWQTAVRPGNVPELSQTTNRNMFRVGFWGDSRYPLCSCNSIISKNNIVHLKYKKHTLYLIGLIILYMFILVFLFCIVFFTSVLEIPSVS